MMSPVVNMSSKHYLKKYCESLYPPLESFMNGKWIKLKDILPQSIECVLLVENYEMPADVDSLEIELWVGFDGAGSFRQFKHRDIKIDTRNLVSGK